MRSLCPSRRRSLSSSKSAPTHFQVPTLYTGHWTQGGHSAISSIILSIALPAELASEPSRYVAAVATCTRTRKDKQLKSRVVEVKETEKYILKPQFAGIEKVEVKTIAEGCNFGTVEVRSMLCSRVPHASYARVCHRCAFLLALS